MSRRKSMTCGVVVLLALSIAIVADAQVVRTDSEVRRATPELAGAIWARARNVYANLAAWHFEHRVVMEETEGAGQPTSIADVTLVTANQTGAGRSAGASLASLCADRCRLEARTSRGTEIVVRDGKTIWSFSSPAMEYMKGEDLRDVFGATASGMLMMPHLAAQMSLGIQKGIGARLLDDEAVEIGGARRDCYVVEVTLKPLGIQTKPDPPPASAEEASARASTMFSGAAGFLMLLRLRGMTELPQDIWHTPLPSSSGPTARVTWWIDKERYLVLRRMAVENALKVPTNAPSAQSGTEVQLRLTETFTVATIAGSLPDALFRFEPPAGAKQVPNRYGR